MNNFELIMNVIQPIILFIIQKKKICLEQCNNNDYIIYNTNICITFCRNKDLYYDDINKTCVPDCKLVNGRNFTKLNGSCLKNVMMKIIIMKMI